MPSNFYHNKLAWLKAIKKDISVQCSSLRQLSHYEKSLGDPEYEFYDNVRSRLQLILVDLNGEIEAVEVLANTEQKTLDS